MLPKKWKKIMRFLEAPNVVTSRPPECRPTGTPTTHANFKNKMIIHLLSSNLTLRVTQSMSINFVYYDMMETKFQSLPQYLALTNTNFYDGVKRDRILWHGDNGKTLLSFTSFIYVCAI